MYKLIVIANSSSIILISVLLIYREGQIVQAKRIDNDLRCSYYHLINDKYCVTINKIGQRHIITDYIVVYVIKHEYEFLERAL